MNKRTQWLDTMTHGLCGLALGSVCALAWHYVVVGSVQVNDQGIYMFARMPARTAVGYGFIAPVAGLILGAMLGRRYPIPFLRKRIIIVFAAILSIVTLTQFVLAGVPVKRIGRDAPMGNPASLSRDKLHR